MSRQPTPLRSSLLLAALLGLAGGAYANNFSKEAYSGAKTDIKTQYKAERDKCASMSGNAKDVCVEEAKGREKVALAQLEYNYTGKAKDERKLAEERYEAAYNIAKEKCDDLSGDAKDVCVREAKTNRDKAKADVKLAKAVTNATDDAQVAKNKADYKLAMEKCDTLSGTAKDTCVASAKARYNEKW